MSDSLRMILAHIRRALPSVPEEVWTNIERNIRQEMGATRPYIAARAKREQHHALDNNPDADIHKLAAILGVSVRHARRLKRGK